MKKLATTLVIIAMTQAVLLSALATALVSLTPAANAKTSCSGGNIGSNPQGRGCGNPNELGGGAPPAPACGHKNSFKNSGFCRAE